MSTTLAHELRGRIGSRLTELGFRAEPAAKGSWAARKTRCPQWHFGCQTLVYCLSWVLDERCHIVRIWDAVLETRQGFLLPRPSRAGSAGYSAVRAELKRLAHEAGWHFQSSAAPPRVFQGQSL